MGIKSIYLAAMALVISTSANAALVTQGYLTSHDDGSSNIITDSLNEVEYLRFDVLAQLTYTETLAALSTQDGGGWAIASSTDAVNFMNSLLTGASACTHNGVDVTYYACGTLSNWYDGKLGDNFNGHYDLAWFLDDNGQADHLQIHRNGSADIWDYGSIASTDDYIGPPGSGHPVSWLVVRPTVVPIPPTVWLFGSGLIGLIAVARRKKV